MIRVASVYFSRTDVTGQMVRALEKAIRAADLRVFSHRISDEDFAGARFRNPAVLQEVTAADAVIFATPTYMGGPAAQFKAFADASSECWAGQDWAGKIAAGITCGNNFNGDQQGTLQYLATLASQHGMLWAGLDAAAGYNEHGVNRLGCQLGVVARSPDGRLHDADRASAVYLARRVADLARRFRAGSELVGQPRVNSARKL